MLRETLALCLAVCAASSADSLAASTTGPAESAPPIITLDPDAHTGPIRRIAVDGTQTILVTASDDKSSRVWDLASGKSIATLHTPAGSGPVGRLYGAAVSPDNVVALGGTTATAVGSHRIYLFDLGSRAFTGAFDARGGDIKRLEWSADGRLLAAAYADSPAVRLFDPRGNLVFEEALKGDAYSVKFSSTGRLAVSATDRKIHLYRITGDRVAPDGAIETSLDDPRGIDFSPDGNLLAVGYLSRVNNDRVRVDVYDLASRSLARTFLFSDVARGNLMNVAWQRNGRALYAGGTGYSGRNRFVVKRIAWPEGSVAEIDVGTNSILDFAALRDDGMVFATGEPSWGVIERDRVLSTVVSPTAQFYEASALGINRDGREISWKYAVDKPPVNFNVTGRQFEDGIGDTSAPTSPSTTRVRVSDWENNFFPKVNGRPVSLARSEVARAAAILPGDSGVVLGTSRSLRRLDLDGSERWTVSLPTEIRALSVTADGRIIVSAMLDGTIRWWRAADGALLMSFFSTRDRKWVLWTDTGYFDVSPGAENLVGWIVNRPEGERADYYPISRFRGVYLRPDVIDRVLSSVDVTSAVADANKARLAQAAAAESAVRQRVEALVAVAPVQAALPPTITLLSPATIESRDTRVTVDYALSAQVHHPVNSVTVRVDGRPYTLFMNQPSTNDANTGKLILTLPQKDSQVQIFAANETGVSAPATMTYRYRPPPAPQPAPLPADTRPRLFLLSIGVSRYANAAYDLEFAAKDATDFAQTMRRQNGQFYRLVDARILIDGRATRANILEALKWLNNVTSAGDVGMLYLAGHGINDIDDTYYFLPHDVDVKHLGASAIGEADLRGVLTAMKGRSIFFVDTCYSGKAIGVLTSPDLTRMANGFSNPENGVIVFSASYGRQESRESRAWGNGAFTKALVDGLIGQADYRHDGFVTHKGLDYYVSNQVKKLTLGSQTPVTTVPIGLADFGLAKVLITEPAIGQPSNSRGSP